MSAQRGRPATPKTGKDAIGVKLFRGKNKDVLFWISDANRYAPPNCKTPIWHYVWKSKCTTCGKSHAQPLHTSYLPIKQGKEIAYRMRCEKCRGEAGAGKAVVTEPVSYTGLSLEDQSDKIMMVLYKPLKAGRTVDVDWEQYSREAVKDACTRLIHANIKPPADMAAFLGVGSNG